MTEEPQKFTKSDVYRHPNPNCLWVRLVPFQELQASLDAALKKIDTLRETIRILHGVIENYSSLLFQFATENKRLKSDIQDLATDFNDAQIAKLTTALQKIKSDKGDDAYHTKIAAEALGENDE